MTNRKQQGGKESRNLPAGRWRPEVHQRLSALLEAPPSGRPVAVFDFDNTCILGDIGELFSHYLIDEMRYRYDLNDFWDEVHPDDGKKELKKITEEALNVRADERENSPIYQDYLAEMGALYGRRYRREGRRACYEWAVRLHVGLTEEEMRRWTAEAIERELRRERGVEERRCQRGEVVQIHRGIRTIQEIRDLFGALEAAGFDVWIVSATNIWSVQVFGAYFGIPRERILGNRVEVKKGRLTSKPEHPVLFREGKVEAIEKFIGKRPALVAGDTITDYEMLCMADKVSLVIDRGHKLLRSEGAKRGWAMQPQVELTATGPEAIDGEPLWVEK